VKKNRACRLVERFVGAFRRTRGGGSHGQAIERRFLLGLLFCLVLVETISSEPSTKGEVGCSPGLIERRAIADIDRDGRLLLPGTVKMSNEIAAEMLEQPSIGQIRLAEPGEDNAAHRQVG